MLYKTANKWAKEICEQLMPLCSDIAIAGSIRRGCGLCGDIDIVCLASDTQRQAVRSRCLRKKKEIRQDGNQILSIVLTNGIHVQIFFAHPKTPDLFAPIPCNWGSIMLCRTGPKEFNQSICIQAAKLGYKWNPFKGIISGDQIIASKTEAEIFKTLHIKPINPRNRKNIHLPEITI